MHERLTSGDLVQVLLHKRARCDSRFIQVSETGVGQHSYFVVGFFIRCKSGALWASVKQCRTHNSFRSQVLDFNKELIAEATLPAFFSTNDASPMSFLCLDHRVRKIGVVPNCCKRDMCSFDHDSNVIKQLNTTLTGGDFLLLTRSLSYPPRRS